MIWGQLRVVEVAGSTGRNVRMKGSRNCGFCRFGLFGGMVMGFCKVQRPSCDRSHVSLIIFDCGRSAEQTTN